MLKENYEEVQKKITEACKTPLMNKHIFLKQIRVIIRR